MKILLKKGDKVIVLTGKDKGKTGIVEKIISKTGSIVVTGVSLVKKHVKVSKKYPSGGTVDITKPILIGKVQLICPSCNKPTRIGLEVKGKVKTRLCKRCKKPIMVAAEKKEK